MNQLTTSVETMFIAENPAIDFRDFLHKAGARFSKETEPWLDRNVEPEEHIKNIITHFHDLEYVTETCDAVLAKFVECDLTKYERAIEREKAKFDVLEIAYKEMLDKVQNWQPPSGDKYIEFKESIIEKLNEQIRSLDKEIIPILSGPKPAASVEEYRSSRQGKLIRDIKYHCEQYERLLKYKKEGDKWERDMLANLYPDTEQ